MRSPQSSEGECRRAEAERDARRVGMTQLLHKIGRAAAILFAALVLAGTAFMFTACQSSQPKVTISVSFNGKTYNLSYRLYRKFFPNTVQHFIELVDADFYDGLCFHDYDEAVGMFTGGYTYDDALVDTDTLGLSEKNYFDWVEASDVSLTQTVFGKDSDGDGVPDSDSGLNTVVGEFSQNNYSIENNDKKYGAKKEGSLVMYYTAKKGVPNTQVFTKRETRRTDVEGDAQWYDTRSYVYNSATSLFYISFTSESSVNSEYCVFGELYDESAEETYDSLIAAIDSYISSNNLDGENEGDPSFTEEAELSVDDNAPYCAGYNLTETYDVPVKPITINWARVDRY